MFLIEKAPSRNRNSVNTFPALVVCTLVCVIDHNDSSQLNRLENRTAIPEWSTNKKLLFATN